MSGLNYLFQEFYFVEEELHALYSEESETIKAVLVAGSPRERFLGGGVVQEDIQRFTSAILRRLSAPAREV